MTNCSNCNQPNPEDSVFCAFCGQRMNVDVAQKTSNDNCNSVEKISMFTALGKYAEFNGRATRKEFWLHALFLFLFFLLLNVVEVVCAESGEEVLQFYTFIDFILRLILFSPTVAVFCRRMHDTGRSGWNFLWAFLPIIGPLILLIYECLDSQPGENKYGPNPKGL